MENKQLIKTDTMWYRIYKKIRNLFVRKNSISNKINKVKPKKRLFEDENQIRKLAERLLNKEIGVTDLTDNEVDKMTEYFIKDIKEVDRELERVKNNILRMQRILEGLE